VCVCVITGKSVNNSCGHAQARAQYNYNPIICFVEAHRSGGHTRCMIGGKECVCGTCFQPRRAPGAFRFSFIFNQFSLCHPTEMAFTCLCPHLAVGAPSCPLEHLAYQLWLHKALIKVSYVLAGSSSDGAWTRSKTHAG
jgi:hypothetical protein